MEQRAAKPQIVQMYEVCSIVWDGTRGDVALLYRCTFYFCVKISISLVAHFLISKVCFHIVRAFV